MASYHKTLSVLADFAARIPNPHGKEYEYIMREYQRLSEHIDAAMEERISMYTKGLISIVELYEILHSYMSAQVD